MLFATLLLRELSKPMNPMQPEFVDVIIDDARWVDVGLEKLANLAAAAVLECLDMPVAGYEISLLGCDDARIAALNQEFRKAERATNVLSWPSEERSNPGKQPIPPKLDASGIPTELGDIAISYDTCKQEAAEFGKELNHHVTHLIVHAVLHLLGYDHIIARDAAIMEAIEVEILGKMGISDPYTVVSVKE